MKRLIPLFILLPTFALGAVFDKPVNPDFNAAYSGPNGLTAPSSYYHIDEGTGTTLNDLAGSFDGTITGATWNTVDGSTVLTCVDAENDHVLFGNWGITDFPFTFAIWIFHKDTDNQDASISVADSSEPDRFYLLAKSNGDSPNIQARNDAPVEGTTIESENPVGAWHMIVGVFSSATSRSIYYDNTDTDTGTASVSFAAVDRGAICVNAQSSLSGHAEADVAGVAIWNDTALTANQVQFDLWNGGSWAPFATGGHCVPCIRRRR